MPHVALSPLVDSRSFQRFLQQQARVELLAPHRCISWRSRALLQVDATVMAVKQLAHVTKSLRQLLVKVKAVCTLMVVTGHGRGAAART